MSGWSSDVCSSDLHCGFPEKSELASCPSKRHARFGRNGKPTESGGFIAQARAAGRLTATAAHAVFVDLVRIRCKSSVNSPGWLVRQAEYKEEAATGRLWLPAGGTAEPAR